MQAIVRYSNSAYLRYWELSVEPTLYGCRVKFSVSRRPRLSLAAFLALAAIAAGASACSSSDEPSREAAHLGTRICILNSWTEKVFVQWTTKDTDTGTGPVVPGMQVCAEGSSSSIRDVGGDFEFPASFGSNPIPLKFGVNNPVFGPPFFMVGGGTPDFLCLDAGYEVGGKRAYDDGTLRMSVERLPDDGWKEFILIIEPSQPGPSDCSPGNPGSKGGVAKGQTSNEEPAG
jgi:hypothetical protein